MYPTETWPAPGPEPAPRRRGRTSTPTLVPLAIVVGVLLGGCIALTVDVGRAGDAVKRSQAAERDAVAAPACRLDGLGLMAGTMAVTNHSSKRSYYLIEVTFEGADGAQLATAHAFVSALGPGQHTQATAHPFTRPPPGPLPGGIVKMDRMSDVG